MLLEGKTAVVTGGASGIGLACATAFAENGAAGVLMADINEEKGQEEAELLRSRKNCDVRYVHTDVSDEASVKRMADVAMEAWGRVDILINNASICPVVSWDEITKENWDRVIGINLTGMFLCTKEIVQWMRRQQSGRIIFMTSTGALDGSHIAHVAYGVSKAGVIALMKSTAKEFAQDNILVSAVMPGPTDTELSRGFTASQREKFVNGTLLKRYGQPSEIAEAVLFMSGPGASFITGTTLQVSGGEILV